MMTENTALELAKSWYRAATTPGTELQVSVLSSSENGWMARAVAIPRPAQPLPMLQISPKGAVSVIGGPFNTMLR
jgi:hypothetical protein